MLREKLDGVLVLDKQIPWIYKEISWFLTKKKISSPLYVIYSWYCTWSLVQRPEDQEFFFFRVEFTKI